METRIYFDGPEAYGNKQNFHEKGGSPHLLDKLIETLEANKKELVEINLSWYLFNNLLLHTYFKKLAREGIIINVFTIPLEGYDNTNPKKIRLENGQLSDDSFTKYGLAKKIFGEMYHDRDLPNYNIFFFPHLYVRSRYVKKFSRGDLPYSLHLKAAYLKTKEGGIVMLSSSNLAGRDLVKYEALLTLKNVPGYQLAFGQFFEHLKSNSIPIKKFSSTQNTTDKEYPLLPSPNTEKFFLQHLFISTLQTFWKNAF